MAQFQDVSPPLHITLTRYDVGQTTDHVEGRE